MLPIRLGFAESGAAVSAEPRAEPAGSPPAVNAADQTNAVSLSPEQQLILAARVGDFLEMQEALKRGADINVNGGEPLWTVVRAVERQASGDYNKALDLLTEAKGINVDLRGNGTNTVMGYARAKLAIAQDSWVKANAWAQTNSEFTNLVLAADSRIRTRVNVIKKLLNARAKETPAIVHDLAMPRPMNLADPQTPTAVKAVLEPVAVGRFVPAPPQRLSIGGIVPYGALTSANNVAAPDSALLTRDSLAEVRVMAPLVVRDSIGGIGGKPQFAPQISAQPQPLGFSPVAPQYLRLTEVNNVAGTISPVSSSLPHEEPVLSADLRVPPVGPGVSINNILGKRKRSIKLVLRTDPTNGTMTPLGTEVRTKILTLHPEAEIVFKDATNNAAVAALNVDPGDEIVAFFIDSGGRAEIMDQHGKVVNQKRKFGKWGWLVNDVPSDPKERISAIAPCLGSPDDAAQCPFLVFLNNAKQLDKLFGFAMKHFAANVKVIVRGCEVLADAKSDWEIMKLMEIFSENFQIKTGYLFLSSGLADEADLYPASTDQNASGLAKARDKLVYWACEIGQNCPHLLNQGYLLEKQIRLNGVYYALYKDRLDDTQRNDGPPPNTKPLVEEFIPFASPHIRGPLVNTNQAVFDAGNLAQSLNH